MLASIRHKALLVLGIALLAVVMAACDGGAPMSSPEPTPDIEATVEARLKEERVSFAITHSSFVIYNEV